MKNCKMIDFRDRPVPNIFKDRDHILDFPIILKTNSLKRMWMDLHKYHADSRKSLKGK